MRFLRHENSFLKGQDLLRDIEALPPLPAPASRQPTPPLVASGNSDSSDSDSDSDAESTASSIDSDVEMRRRERIMRSTETIRGEYAVLPAGIAWDDWSEEERSELDDYVRHLMHSRRERFRRRMRGFFQFVSRRTCLSFSLLIGLC